MSCAGDLEHDKPGNGKSTQKTNEKRKGRGNVRRTAKATRRKCTEQREKNPSRCRRGKGKDQYVPPTGGGFHFSLSLSLSSSEDVELEPKTLVAEGGPSSSEEEEEELKKDDNARIFLGGMVEVWGGCSSL